MNTQPIMAGLDSKGDDNSLEIKLLSDINSVRDNTDYNSELANSLIEIS